MRPRRRDSQRAGSVGQVERSTRYRNLANPFAPVRVFSDDQVENMHLAALGILEEPELSGENELAGLYELFRERIAEMQIEPPPPDWDGVFVATEK